MNVRMWEHQSTKQNLNKLKTFDYKIIGPEIGDMACGEYGEGKMSDPSTIATEIDSFFLKQKNLSALITSGPTKEQIDPVRFISNESSGKQGYAIAQSLFDMGAKTTLITGPTNISLPQGPSIIKVNTAEEMLLVTEKSIASRYSCVCSSCK